MSTMVKETRIIFDIQDIRRIEIVCGKCGGAVVNSLCQRSFHLPERCPHCYEEWISQRLRSDRVLAETIKLVEAMHYLTGAAQPDQPLFTARFAIDGES